MLFNQLVITREHVDKHKMGASKVPKMTWGTESLGTPEACQAGLVGPTQA
jgi:hypothetical protein